MNLQPVIVIASAIVIAPASLSPSLRGESLVEKHVHDLLGRGGLFRFLSYLSLM